MGHLKASLEFRPYEVDLVGILDAPLADSLRFQVSGRARSAFRLSSYDVYFGEEAKLFFGEDFPETEIVAKCHTEVDDLRVENPGNLVEINVDRRNSADDPFVVQIRPRSDLEIGPFSTTVRFSAVLPNGESLPAIPIRVHGEIRSSIAAMPDSFNFGIQGVGKHAEGEIVLVSRTGRPFKIQSVKCSSDEITAIPSAEGDAKTRHLVRVAVMCSRVGGNEGQVMVKALLADGKVVPVIIPVRGYVGKD